MILGRQNSEINVTLSSTGTITNVLLSPHDEDPLKDDHHPAGMQKSVVVYQSFSHTAILSLHPPQTKYKVLQKYNR